MISCTVLRHRRPGRRRRAGTPARPWL